jgi:hypothetical protein
LSIRAILDELDGWIGEQSRKRKANNVLHQIGAVGLLASDEQKLQATNPPKVTSDEPNCLLCQESGHVTADCEQVLTCFENRGDNSEEEDPSRIIHRGLLHRLYIDICILYRLHYGDSWGKLEKAAPKPSRVNYYEIAVAGAVEDFKSTTFTTGQIRQQSNECKVVIGHWYSQAFPGNYENFCNKVANILDSEERCQYRMIKDTCQEPRNDNSARAE